MKLLRALLISALLTVLLFAIAPHLTRAWRVTFESDNQPPFANNDNYTRHGSGLIGPVLLNDSDPDAPRPHGHVNNPAGLRIGPDGSLVRSNSRGAHLLINHP